MNANTAEAIFTQVEQLSTAEQDRFFVLIARRTFSQNQPTYTHEEVFGDINTTPFTAGEAAEYLEISMATLRRLIKAKHLTPCQRVGRSRLFALDDLRRIKRQRTAVSNLNKPAVLPAQ